MGIYINAMETLVEQEVAQQMQELPVRVASYINRKELAAYALNQLPALYATSQRGLQYQLQRGRSKYTVQLKDAVHRALIAIQRDPLRSHAPVKAEHTTQMQDVLHRLQVVLKDQYLTWESVPAAVEQALKVKVPAQALPDLQSLSNARSLPDIQPNPQVAEVPPAQPIDLHPILEQALKDSQLNTQVPDHPVSGIRPAVEHTTPRRHSPYMRQYSTIPASSPFPEMPTSGMPDDVQPDRSKANPAAFQAGGTQQANQVNQANDTGVADGWDDPFRY